MKTIFLSIVLTFYLSTPLFPQFIALQKGDRVEVRSADLKYITSSYYSNLMKIGATDDYVVLHYDNGKIEVRDSDLKYISLWYL